MFANSGRTAVLIPGGSVTKTLSSAVLTGALAVLAVTGGAAAESALWLRYPAISPNGHTIVFSYRGDLYRVSSSGGEATPLTLHEAHDTRPVWSPDGSQIAFASDRYGNFDVYVISAKGGQATRLTFHSADDTPFSFTPDGGAVLFGSTRLDSYTSVGFPTGAQPELYRVSTEGGMPRQVLSTPAEYAVLDSTGQRLAYSDRKGFEDEWRKHDDSSFARDLWLFDVVDGSHTRLTEPGADDRQPVWSPDERSLFYLSERSGTFNVWQFMVDDPGEASQLTMHDTHPVRFLSASQGGGLCYTWDGRIWLRPANSGESRPIDVTVATDARHNEIRWIDVAREITEFDLSPDGEEIAFIARGEVFVTSTDHDATRRVTDTPEQERSVSFSPDGRSLVYAAERNGSWNLYRTDLTDDDEPSFFNATALEEKPILEVEAETFQPRFSPDGSEVAYLEQRTELKVVDLLTGRSRSVMPGDRSFSYVDGDQWYDWSPDGRWFLVQYFPAGKWGDEEIGLVPASGEGEFVNITRSGYWDIAPRWAMKGEMMVWRSDRHGSRKQAGWPAQYDVYGSFFTREAWDRFRMTEAEFEQHEKKEKETDDEGGAADDEHGDDGIKLPDPVDLDLDRLEDRTVRLSLHSSELADARITPDGEQLLYLAKFEKGYDLWLYEHRKNEVKLLAKLNAEDADGLQLDKDGTNAFVLADRSIKVVEVAGGKVTPVAVHAKMELDAAAERAYLFEHAWRQTREKFYDENLHGVDWEFFKTEYAKFLPHIDNNWDFAELISELQGELNASHLGSGHRPRREGADATASLGLLPDPEHAGDGIRILEVLEGGPVEQADTKVAAGVIIEAIDDVEISAGSNWYRLLNHKADTPVRLALLDPDTGTRWHETVKPITASAERRLLYTRWVRSRRAEVERLSGGRLGYAHIRGMSDGPYREIFDEVFGKHPGKEGLVLDTRFNGGGNLVEALTVFLSGDVYYRLAARGRDLTVEPRRRWTKPSVVVMNEGNYSDAHCFPAAYTALGIGETVGMQVPGTCTSVWWETLQDRSLYFGIPQIGHVDVAGEMTENKHLDPDHVIDNDPALEAAGRDQQLEKAVEVLLTKIDG
jgi:Tol biopolymer transport system component/C-terminal processing protease CtpA/Prc